MQVTSRRRKPVQQATNQGINGNKSSGSRFDSIANLDDANQGKSTMFAIANILQPDLAKEDLRSLNRQNNINDSHPPLQGKSSNQIINNTNSKSMSSINMQGHAIRNNSKAQGNSLNDRAKNKLASPVLPSSKNIHYLPIQSYAEDVSPTDVVHNITNASSSSFSPLLQISTTLDPCKHSAVSISTPPALFADLSTSNISSPRDKFNAKSKVKSQSHWKVKINKNSKSSIKVRKKKETTLPPNSSFTDLMLEMSNPVSDNSLENDGIIHSNMAGGDPSLATDHIRAAKTNFLRTFRSFRDCYNPSLVVLVEPRISGPKADKVIKRSGFDFSHRVEAQGFSGGIWILWKPEVHVSVLVNHRQFIHTNITYGACNEQFLFTAVYGSPQPFGRRSLWNDLSALGIATNVPWLLAGDFNAILNSNDRKGGSRLRCLGCPYFNNFMDSNALAQIDFVGPALTWRRGNLLQRLDRALCNDTWLKRFPDALTHHLPRINSDHRPILVNLNINNHSVQGNKPFRFLASWITHNDFQQVVASGWNNNFSLQENVHQFTVNIRNWNTNVFGNVFKQKKNLMARISGIEKYLESRPSQFLTTLESQLQNELAEVLLREEALWIQKSRSDWIMFGDRNTSYFHAKFISRKKKNQVNMLKDSNGIWHNDETFLRNLAVSFYIKLFTEDVINRPIYDYRGFFPLIDNALTNNLSREITKEDIHRALFQMMPWKSPGIDGIPAGFYQNQWPVVGISVCNLIKRIFQNGEMDNDLNRTLISLIPKSVKPETIKDFRPISLCTVMYKLVTKIITNKLKPIMPLIVSPTQVSFIEGRNITDNIIIVQEVIHFMRTKKGKKGWFAIKVDLEKAFDCLNWDFIKDTLVDARLPNNLVTLIMHCVSSSHMNLLWNGSISEEFKPSRGIRQGDPLSPYLFVLCMERLSHRICSAVHNGDWAPIKLNRTGPNLSHLFFADDLILFGQATEDQSHTVNAILEEFSLSSGLRVSLNKTQIFFSANVEFQKAEQISNLLGFQRAHDLGKYLGVPLLHSRVTKETYAFIVNKIKHKLSGWNSSLLSLAGRLSLAKSVLMSIPGYAMQTTSLPNGLCDQIDRLVRNFVWGNHNGSHKPSLVNWEVMCSPCSNGGGGIQKLKNQNKAFLMKIGFNVIAKPELFWVQVVRNKYGWTRNNNSCNIKGPCSVLWRNLHHLWHNISYGTHCALGDGRIINFWSDNWVADLGPLRLLAFSPLQDSELTKKVIDFTANGAWNWKLFENLVPSSVLLHIAAVHPPSASAGPDETYWGLSSNGVFSVNSAYKMQENFYCDNDRAKWRSIWQWPGAPRVRTLLWLAANNKLLTNFERCRRHMTTDASCFLCGHHSEDTDHVLRHCVFAREVWRKIHLINCLNIRNDFFTSPFDSWLFNNLQNHSNSRNGNWSTTFGLTLWSLWLHRNNLVFKDERCSSDSVAQKIKCLVDYTTQAQRFAILSNPGLGNKKEHLICWTPPPTHVLKINSDGAVRLPDNKAASGGIARDSTGSWVFGYSRLIGHCSVLQSELWGALDGLDIAWNKGFRNVILEMDSKLAVDAIAKNRSPTNANSNLLNAIRCILNQDWQVHICHIHREGNRSADSMASQGFYHNMGLTIYDNMPQDVAHCFMDDLAGVSLPRMCRSL
ncbi:uncharacterized protein LOC126687968 [Mercurialis annua]|uniref:uncharacterized protein LOC126687968 n=1 Tax=Mercurialis annua TaxID=3986 RepID=UPI0024ADB2FD|nr:uncharacterized protein LOC126687968 [Mercurialis annua]